MIPCLVAAALLAAGAAGSVPASAQMFRDGDRVAFEGDSITARNVAYHEFVADYYLTRFPDADIRFTNAGSNGDGATGACRRFADDVAARRPTAVALMFGMNDVGRSSYGDGVTEELALSQDRRLASYARNYAALLDEVRAQCGDVPVYLLTPSPFDENRRLSFVNKAIKNWPGVNAGLGRCAAIVRALAAERGATLVDGYAALNAWMRETRLADDKSVFASDRVHPGAAMNLMLAMAFLRAQNAERVVSDIAIQDGRVALSIRAEVTDVATNAAGGVAFTVLEKALPMPFGEEVAGVTNHPDVVAFNQEILTIYGLAEGDWTLAIDGADVATASAWEWENGVNLAFNARTPQWAQAQRVLAAHREAGARAYFVESEYPRIRRDVRKELEKRGLDPASPEARAGYIAEMLPKVSYWKTNRDAWEGARDNWDRIDELIAEHDAVWPRIRALAKPAPHRYELKRKTEEKR